MSETATDEERAALRDTSEKIAELLMDRHDLTDARNAALVVGCLATAIGNVATIAAVITASKANSPNLIEINIEYMLDAAHNASRKAAFKFLEEARKLREAQDRSEQS